MVFDDFIQLDRETLISCLEGYQQELVRALIDNNGGNYEKAADSWLSARPSNTVPFGGELNRSSLFREKIVEELEKFICGCDDGKYDNVREELNKQGDITKEAIISALSAVIGSTIGVSAAFIAPVIVMVVLGFGQISKNAWCEMRKELKNKRE